MGERKEKIQYSGVGLFRANSSQNFRLNVEMEGEL